MQTGFHIRRIIFILVSTLLGVYASAQNNPKVSFNGAAQGRLDHSWLPESDTTNIDEETSGKAFIDLGVDINPNENIKIHSLIRFQSEVGGFWGPGGLIDISELSIKGVAGKFLKYRFGDIDCKMTPYTLWNNNPELSENEAEVFRYMRDLQHYENYNNENYWRQQGLHLQSRLAFDKGIDNVDIIGFIFRNRTLSNGITPDRLQGGGQLICNINKESYLGINYINLFDLPQTVDNNAVEKKTNGVLSADLNFDFKALYLFGELGMSNLTYVDTNDVKNIDETGLFYEAGLGKEMLKKQLSIKASFRRVEENFYSPGAQSLRINDEAVPEVLTTVSELSEQREVGMLDMMRYASVYNQQINPELMQYNPLFNNVTPYGKATPNRQGGNLTIDYTDSLERFSTGVNAELLSEVRGEGTEELRTFALIQWNGKLAFNKIFSLKKTLNLTAAYQLTTSKRDGLEIVDDVNLTSHCFDVGLEFEFLKRVDLLLGTKYLMYSGTDYISVRNEFNAITDYTKKSFDGNQNLSSAAIRYRFNDNIFLTLQANRFGVTDKLDSQRDYQINQVLLLFNLLF